MLSLKETVRVSSSKKPTRRLWTLSPRTRVRQEPSATTELFGPFQVLVKWSDGQLPMVLEALNRMQNHLTAGIVSNDVQFLNEVLEGEQPAP